MLRRKSQKGTIFVTIAFVLAIIFVLVSFVFTIMTNELKIMRVNADTNIVSYIALSGIEKGMAYILGNPGSSYAENNPSIFSYKKEHALTWYVNFNAQDNSYTIISEAFYGKSKKSITRKVRISSGNKISIVE